MIQMNHIQYSTKTILCQVPVWKGMVFMSLKKKRIITLIIVILIAAVLGRLAVRFVMNMMLGGTLFGGDFL